jgi:hypothetical protein
MAVTLVVLVLINILGYVALYFVLRERLRRASSPKAQMGELREEVNRLMVELNQTTDRNISLLEDKIASLTELISKAEKTLTMLHREGEKHEVGSRVYGRIIEARAPRPASRGGERTGGEPHLEEVRRRGGTTAVDSERTPARREAAPSTAPEEDKGRSADTRDRVVELYKAGLTASLIAARVGAPLGEVELIISLAERKGL